MDPATLAALAASAAALAATAAALRRIGLLEERLRGLEEGVSAAGEAARGLRVEVERLQHRLAVLERALARALESYEAEDALEKLRRRRRRRYIAFYVVTEDGEPPPPEEVEKAVMRAVERLAGELTVAKARLQLVYYQPERGAGIIRANHETKYLVLAAMGLVRRVAGKRAVLIPVRTTGTIRTAKRVLGLPQRELKKTK